MTSDAEAQQAAPARMRLPAERLDAVLFDVDGMLRTGGVAGHRPTQDLTGRDQAAGEAGRRRGTRRFAR
jgi:hypothetical protein